MPKRYLVRYPEPDLPASMFDTVEEAAAEVRVQQRNFSSGQHVELFQYVGCYEIPHPSYVSFHLDDDTALT